MGGFGGFGGGGGGNYRSISHSESDVDGVIAYNAVELVVEDGSMSRLKVGDEELDLELKRNSFLVTDGQPSPTFTASFTSWHGDQELYGIDTLVLAACDVQPEQEGCSYTWSFSGAVYKKLAASGIDYLVLQIGEQTTALSTAGFSAGIRYSMYRAEGLPSKEFRYSVTMGMSGSPFEMDVSVAGDTYRMSADPNAEFYYYDVYSGTADQFRPQQG